LDTNDPPPTAHAPSLHTLALHDALPIWPGKAPIRLLDDAIVGLSVDESRVNVREPVRTPVTQCEREIRRLGRPVGG
ncbi:hypothetical protein PJP06_29535, partial [Mycobacterium kansasii]